MQPSWSPVTSSAALRAVVAVALLAAAAGLLLIGLSAPAGGASVTSRGLPINAGAADPRDFSAHNSPVIARSPTDPDTLVVANRVDAPLFSCALHTSSDNGGSWQARDLPFPTGEEQPERCYAPDVAFGPDGTLHVSFVTLAGLANTPNAGWVASSTDGGQSFSTPQRALGPLAFQASLAADPHRAGRLWLTWLQAEHTASFALPEPGNPIMVASSEDGGETWSDPVRVSAPARTRVLGPSIETSGDNLHLAYLDVGEDALDYHGGHEGRGGPPYPGPWSLVLARSHDAGETWQETVIDEEVVATERFVVFIPPAPSLAVDAERDRVYVGFHDGRDGDADVRVWASTDGGASFVAGTRVNDNPAGDGTDQYLPALAVAPGGRLDVVYYDRRADPDNVANEVSLQSSTDAASTFEERVVLSDRAFDARIGPGSERDLTDLGSRLGLASTDERALAVWTDTRAGTEASAKQDLARASVAFTAPSPLRRVLPVLAGLLAAAALAVGLVRPRRTPVASRSTAPTATVAAGAAEPSAVGERHGR